MISVTQHALLCICAQSRKPIPVMVYFSDGSYRTISGQPQTTIYDLTLAMIRTYELPHRANASPEDFMWAVHEEDLGQCCMFAIGGCAVRTECGVSASCPCVAYRDR